MKFLVKVVLMTVGELLADGQVPLNMTTMAVVVILLEQVLPTPILVVSGMFRVEELPGEVAVSSQHA